MKVIFLDIDGVLNWQSCKASAGSCMGINDKKVKLLKKIVTATNAKIVLSSSWRIGWVRGDEMYHNHLMKYLTNKLRRENLYILDVTKDLGERGTEIKAYLDDHPNITDWVVLDDEIFPYYSKFGILQHLVKTEYYDDNGGLSEKDVRLAIDILNGG